MIDANAWPGVVDIAAVDASLKDTAATHATLLELAGRCALASIPAALRSSSARDPRWRRALRSVLEAAGSSRAIPVSTATRIGELEHLVQMVPVRDGYLCIAWERRAEDATLVRMDRSFSVVASRPLHGLSGKLAILPQPLRAGDEPVLVLYAPGANRSCFVFDDALRVVSRADVRLPDARAEVRYVDRVGDELVIEGQGGMFWAPLVDADDELEFPAPDAVHCPPRRFLSESYFGFVRRMPVWVDGWLTMAGSPELVPGTGWISRELHWVHLDRDIVHTTSLPPSTTGWAVHRGALWLASDGGLHRCEPGEDVELLHAKERNYYGLGSGTDGLILSTRSDEWVTTDHDGNESAHGPLPAGISPFSTHALGDGLLVGNQTWMWVGSEGARASSDRQGTLTVPRDRHVVNGFVSGQSGFVVDGSQLVRVDFPADTIAEASLGDRIVARMGPTRYVFGVDGVCQLEQEELGAPVRTHYGGGWKAEGGLVEDSRVLLVDPKTSDVFAWEPSEHEHVTLAITPSRCIEDQKKEGCRKHNPRDDWADPGLRVDGEVVVARRGRYGGDYGAAGEAEAVHAERGAIVTLEDCVLVRGGMLAEGSSTIIARRCELSKGRYQARPGSHIVLLECKLAAGVELIGSVKQL